MKFIEQFPLTGGPLITLPTAPSPSFVSYHVSATEQIIPTRLPIPGKPNLNWFPVVAVRVATCASAGVGANNAPISINDSLGRVSFMMTRLDNIDGLASPPLIQFQIRTAIGCTPEVVGTGVINVKGVGGFDAVGLIGQVSGFICTQYELWARIEGDPNPAPPAKAPRVGLGLDVIVDRFSSETPNFYKGSVSV